MSAFKNLKPQRVFYYFEKISSIPRGSGNMKGIAQFCEDFAIEYSLKYVRDAADNVVIYKNGTAGYENSEPIILQGHLDMVCQKTDDCTIDFEKDGLELYVDGDFLKARGTTLGADNGIAVAMVLALLESNDILHPPVEAVFTTDEEVGMIGARALDMSVLSGKRMINLDSDAEGIVTVSCAGGSDFVARLPIKRRRVYGTLVTLEIKGLAGGHSGVEINQNRVNANIIAGRIIACIKPMVSFGIISINGGDKANAIPNSCKIDFCVEDEVLFCKSAKQFIDIIKDEILDREPNFDVQINIKGAAECDVFECDTESNITQILICAPNGVIEMSAGIKGLVQTSLNLGILATQDDCILFHFALRSNKQSALVFLESRLDAFFDMLGIPNENFGHYPPWEYRENSPLRDIYCSVYRDMFGKDCKIEAIHAGLECGVFDSAIDDFDCIAIGPALYDIHTTRERLSISSTQEYYNLIIKILEKLK